MKKPAMILFDYGHTLLAEPGYDPVRGTEAVMAHAVKNPRGLTAAEVSAFSSELFDGMFRDIRRAGVELHNRQFQQLLYEYLQIELSVGPEECERLFWEGLSPGAAMPYVGEMLASLRMRLIRSAVVSNISFSGEALKARLDRLLPENDFEFIVASSEYLLRKPSPLLFELALRKANLPAKEVWFCGDRPDFDVEGAHRAGMYPVWYDSPVQNDFHDKSLDPLPSCPHTRIRDWRELDTLLDACEG